MTFRLDDVVASRAEVSLAGEVRESRCRERRDNPSQVRQADLVEAFIVARADERAAMRDCDSESGPLLVELAMAPPPGGSLGSGRGASDAMVVYDENIFCFVFVCFSASAFCIK